MNNNNFEILPSLVTVSITIYDTELPTRKMNSDYFLQFMETNTIFKKSFIKKNNFLPFLILCWKKPLNNSC